MRQKYMLVIVQAQLVPAVMLAATAQEMDKDHMMGQLRIIFHRDRLGMDSFDGTSTPWYPACGQSFQLKECRCNGTLREPFEERWKVPPGRGCNYASQDQGLANDVGCVFDGIAAGKSESAFSDRQMDLAKGLMPQVRRAIDLHSRLDELFLALEDRPDETEDNIAAAESLDVVGTIETHDGDDQVFTIFMVGDSTMRMQADVLSWLLVKRRTVDGRRQCECQPHPFLCKCFRFEAEEDAYGTAVLQIRHQAVAEECVNVTLSADFVYFGCGLHILHLEPERPVYGLIIDRWIHYERYLEKAVATYRSSGKQRRGYLGEAFMNTHSFLVDKLVDPMLSHIRGYERQDSEVLAPCYNKVKNSKIFYPDWEAEVAPEEICTRGYFGEDGVVDLNMRAEALMMRLGVPVVSAYDITRGQAWATAREDGRHYPGLVPLELSQLVAKINVALRRERLDKKIKASRSGG